MAHDYAKSFYNSRVWRKTRDAYAESQYWLCERCYQNGILSEGQIVHHKIYLTPENINDPDVSLNWDNLELLDITCHNQEHFKTEDVVREGLTFDENGDLISKER
ncbi:hypothetical protein GCM10028778_11860 [Barrientosiimonas marina]|uniref:Putative HNH nuclease YajD n=1 Tax=Lentibacillus kimchii TaxID=1542911 RepID=A0ABW2UWQ3_9BACI